MRCLPLWSTQAAGPCSTPSTPAPDWSFELQVDGSDSGFPIIIFGAARSGTTYLTQILNCHPEIIISMEERLFIWVYSSLRVLPGDRVLFPRHLSISDDFRAYLRMAYPALIRDYYLQQKPEAKYWGDKYPHYAAYGNRGTLETASELFPACRFIHLIRDGRDVVVSNIKAQSFDFEEAHNMWRSHVHYGCEFGATVGASRYRELKYEELIADDVGVSRRLFEWLTIPFDPAVEQFCELQRVERTPFRAPSRDLGTAVVESQWPTMLNQSQQLRSLDLLGDGLLELGYETQESLARLRQGLAAGRAPARNAAEE